MNPFFNAMGGQPMNGMGNLMQRYQQFRQSMSGDPQQIINQMMQSGRINQNMLNQAQMMAQQFGGMLR